MKNIPKPVIKSAEFSFKLEYKLQGELIVVEDILVCKYMGIRWDGSIGWHREYDKYIKSNKKTKDIVLCGLEKGAKLYYYTGYPALYLGDGNTAKGEQLNQVYSSTNDNPSTSRKFYNNNSYKDLGVELISWVIDSPIENTFE